MNDQEAGLGVFVMPTEAGKPPRALLIPADEAHPLEQGATISGVLSTWSVDMGCWTVGGAPVPSELGDAITAHARNLGVPGF